MKIRYGRNDFIENDALNFVFYLIDDMKHLRLDYVVSDIYSITQLPRDIIKDVVDLYNQRNQSREEYLAGKLFSSCFLHPEWAYDYQTDLVSF